MNMQRPYVPGATRPGLRRPGQKLSRWTELTIWWREIDRVLLNRSSAAPVFLFVALQAMHTPLPDTEVLLRLRVRVRGQG